jgi:signal transduction histidine kinase
VGLTLIAAGAFWFIPAVNIGAYWAFLLGLFVIAAGMTCLETIANPYATVLGAPESGPTRINIAQTVNGAGWVLGPIVGGHFVFSGGERASTNAGLSTPYIGIGIFVAILLVIFAISQVPDLHTKDENRAAADEADRLRPTRAQSVTIAAVADSKETLCVAFRDITQWKETERVLVDARQRAETASSAKSDFLAKISHEIRTPLNSIIGFSEVMLAEQFGRIGNERYREYLKDIHASGGHLLSLINDLLDLSKIEAGKVELTFTGVALNDLVAQCVATMAPQANRARIIIRTALAPALPAVLADARSVRQIVLNLLSNALKFTPPGGQVIVSTASNGEAEVILRVRDTGVGMSENDIVTALEPFQQLAPSPRGGTGLGLPLTKAMAEANRAKFQLTSTPREGTLVEITFPVSSTLPR